MQFVYIGSKWLEDCRCTSIDDGCVSVIQRPILHISLRAYSVSYSAYIYWNILDICIASYLYDEPYAVSATSVHYLRSHTDHTGI